MLTLLTIAVVGLFCALGFLHFVTNAELDAAKRWPWLRRRLTKKSRKRGLARRFEDQSACGLLRGCNKSQKMPHPAEADSDCGASMGICWGIEASMEYRTCCVTFGTRELTSGWCCTSSRSQACSR